MEEKHQLELNSRLIIVSYKMEYEYYGVLATIKILSTSR